MKTLGYCLVALSAVTLVPPVQAHGGWQRFARHMGFGHSEGYHARTAGCLPRAMPPALAYPVRHVPMPRPAPAIGSPQFEELLPPPPEARRITTRLVWPR